jgi:hypothetical protein
MIRITYSPHPLYAEKDGHTTEVEVTLDAVYSPEAMHAVTGALDTAVRRYHLSGATLAEWERELLHEQSSNDDDEEGHADPRLIP